MERKTRIALKTVWVLALIAGGLLLNHFQVGEKPFAGFGSLGTYLIYIGFFGIFVIGLAELVRKKKVVDERMEFVAAKALRFSFLFVVAVSFIVILIDGIQPITLPYHLFASYLVCGMLLAYFVSYRILLRFY
jgi:hypothetical protein